MRVSFAALIAIFVFAGSSSAQTIQTARLIACSCELKNTVCLTSAEMAQHVIKVEMSPDLMGNHSNYQGIAVFQIGFDEKGRVTGAEAISGDPLGISHLMSAVSNWRFRPVIVNGVKKRACGKLLIRFKMKENVPSTKVVEQE